MDVYAGGVFVCTLADASGITVKINSTDAAHRGITPCYTDASDIAALAAILGDGAAYDICSDCDESGPPTIDAGDIAFFARVLGASCR